jgi:hypothetical protein
MANQSRARPRVNDYFALSMRESLAHSLALRVSSVSLTVSLDRIPTRFAQTALFAVRIHEETLTFSQVEWSGARGANR